MPDYRMTPIPMFRDRDGREFVGEGPSDMYGYVLTRGAVVRVDYCEPLNNQAVIMYEASGGTFGDAAYAASYRRGPPPTKLFARAHAWARMRQELGEGC